MKFKSFYMVEDIDIIKKFARMAADKLGIVYRGINDPPVDNVDDPKYDNNKDILKYRNNHLLIFNDDYVSKTAIAFLIPKDLRDFNTFFDKVKTEVEIRRHLFKKNNVEEDYVDLSQDGGVDVENVDEWPNDKLKQINYIMRRLGYDVRGTEDVKDYIKRLSYKDGKIKSSFKDWVFAIKLTFPTLKEGEELDERVDVEVVEKVNDLIQKIKSFMKEFDGKLDMVMKRVDDNYIISISDIDETIKDLNLVISLENYRYTGAYYKANGENYIKLAILNDMKDIRLKDLYKLLDSKTVYEALAHELTHYFDGKRFEVLRVNKTQKIMKSLKDVKLGDIDAAATYFNLPAEVNARFIQVMSKLLVDLKKDKEVFNFYVNDFNKFYTVVNEMLTKKNEMMFDRLSDDNKKRIRKRIYSFWNELRSFK